MTDAEQLRQRTIGAWAMHLLTHGSSMDRQKRRRVYWIVLAAALTVVWLPAVLFVLLAPRSYTVEWALMLPSAGYGHAVSLESIGQASLPSSSPFANSTIDPRVNTRVIATSRPVLAQAAARVGLSEDDFGEPKIKLVDQTGLMQFRLSGGTAQQALEKALALQGALEAQLESLRQDEMKRRTEAIAAALQSYSDSLDQAERRIMAFQGRSSVVSAEQFNEITVGLERSLRDRDALRARLAGLRGRSSLLRAGLALDEGQASTVARLQNDAYFQQLLDSSASASSHAAEQAARLGPQNFRVVSANASDRGLYEALRKRANEIVGAPDWLPRYLPLANNGDAQAMVRTLVDLETEENGLHEEIVALDALIDSHRERLETGSRDALELEILKRKQQVATAVFTTALAKLDLGKSDVFASYPLTQVLTPPELPRKADTIGIKLAILGALAGSMFCIMGLSVLWIRKPLLHQILKSE